MQTTTMTKVEMAKLAKAKERFQRSRTALGMPKARKLLERVKADLDEVSWFFEGLGLESSAEELDGAHDQIDQVLVTVELLQASMWRGGRPAL